MVCPETQSDNRSTTYDTVGNVSTPSFFCTVVFVLSDLQPLARPMGNPKDLSISLCNAQSEQF